MSEKRSHTKSRYGCRNCKARKVKCDERRPACGNCQRRGVHHECSYTTTPQQTSLPMQQLSLTHVDTARYSSPVPLRPDKRGMDMRLFHHWITSTSHSLPLASARNPIRVWSEQVSCWAFHCDFLLDAILATAALHLWCNDPITNAEMEAVSLNLMNNAASKSSAALSQITTDNAQPLVATSVLTYFQSNATRRFRSHHESYNLPIEMIKLHLGIGATYRAARALIPHTSEFYFQGSRDSILFERGIDPAHQHAVLPSSVQHDAAAVRDHIEASIAYDAARKVALQKALDYMLTIDFGMNVQEPLEITHRRLGGMPSLVPPLYLEMLEQRDPFAMAILARYYAAMRLMNAAKTHWWLWGIPEKEIEGIRGLMPVEWTVLIDFPTQRLKEQEMLEKQERAERSET